LKQKKAKGKGKGKEQVAKIGIIPSYVQTFSSGIKSTPVLSYGIPFGEVTLHQKNNDIWIKMNVYNLAVNCASTQGNNECGVHIHEGSDCFNPGGHLWNKEHFALDPWLNIYYKSDEFGRSITMSKDIIYMKDGNGFSLVDNLNRPIVIHSYNGTKIACGMLKASS
jgi:hypothetical protein